MHNHMSPQGDKYHLGQIRINFYDIIDTEGD